MANTRFQSLTNEELLDTYYDARDKETYSVNERFADQEQTVKDLAEELKARKLAKNPIAEPSDSHWQAVQLMHRIPEWIDVGIEDARFTPDPFEVDGVVDRRTPNVASVGTARGVGPNEQNTLLHELAHIRQLKGAKDIVERDKTTEGYTRKEMDEIINRVLPPQSTPDFNETYRDLLTNYGKVKDPNRGTNYADNPLELFANLEAMMVQGYMQGKAVQETPQGKAMGLEDPKLRKYLYDRTLLGVPKINSLQEPTWQEKMQNTLDKYRTKFLHRQ